jgi:hypothetical protein
MAFFKDPANRNDRIISSWDRIFVPAAIFLFFPVFISTFVCHTDSLFILTQKGNWLGDPEAGVWFLQGRPLGAVINSIAGWFTYKAEDLRWLRILTFILLFLSSRLIYLIGKREKSSYAWCCWTAFIFLLLPNNIIDVIWVGTGINGSLSSLFSIASYFILHHSKPRPLIFRSWLAAMLFLAALMIYPSVAMMVFALMTLKVFESDQENWPQVRTKVLKELLFYVGIMGVYWLLIKLVFIPWGNHLGLIGTRTETYEMQLAHDPAVKMTLFWQAVRYSFIGIWDPIVHFHPLLENTLTVICLAAGTVIAFLLKPAGTQRSPRAGVFSQKLLFIGALFICTNIPSLSAAGCKEVVGYRTLLPSTFIWIAAISYFFRQWLDAVNKGPLKTIAISSIVIYTFAALMAAAWTVNKAVFNNLVTYRYVDALAARIDYTQTLKVYLRYSSPPFFGYSYPFEMGYIPGSLKFLFSQYSAKAGRSVEVSDTFSYHTLLFDRYTQVIDLEFVSNKAPVNERIVYVHPLGYSGAGIAIHENLEQLANFPGISLNDVTSDGKTTPGWTIPTGVPYSFIYLNFIKSPASLYFFKLNADCRDLQGRPSRFLLKWQGLDRQKKWVDISPWTPFSGQIDFAQSVQPWAFKYFSLFLLKLHASDTVVIKDLQFISH